MTFEWACRITLLLWTIWQVAWLAEGYKTQSTKGLKVLGLCAEAGIWSVLVWGSFFL